MSLYTSFRNTGRTTRSPQTRQFPMGPIVIPDSAHEPDTREAGWKEDLRDAVSVLAATRSLTRYAMTTTARLPPRSQRF
jgi:hypothetical protein